MKTVVDKNIKKEMIEPASEQKLSAVYPQLYCPRCGSYEIGLRQFDGPDAIWGCRDCAAAFALDFPKERRF
jgi:ribosomal protein L37AE/L43A